MSQEKHIIALGDSLTAGHIGGSMWGPTYSPYTDVLKAKLPSSITITNHGRDGDLTNGMLRRFQQDVLPEKPDIILLMGGANDLGWEHEPDLIVSNLMTIVDESIAAGITILVGAVPPIERIPSATLKRLELNPMLIEQCEQRDVVFVDLFHPLANDQGHLLSKYSSDGLHLNPEGYAALGEQFHQALLAILSPRR